MKKKSISKTVDPIRKKEDIAKVRRMLRERYMFRDLLLFTMGCNTAFRISDLLKIRIWDVFNLEGNIRSKFILKETKTKKNITITVNKNMRRELQLYQERYTKIVESAENYLFFRKKWFGENKGSVSISGNMAWKLINKWKKEADIEWEDNRGTHTLRKTRGYQARKASVSLALIQHKLNHSSLAITKKYLGITDDEIRDVCESLNI